METHEIRKRFLEHFVKAGHREVPSASLILDDPNLLFVNAGMVPFVPYFLGQKTPEFATATSVQKCVRTLDIENVGHTTRHNTFFQMAGNFSFGDYFKEGAITHAWTLLTGDVADGGLGFDPERLWVTAYYDDDEAAEIWRDKIGIPEERIQRRGMADNYWSMGIPGPCGPCSEIYYDRGPAYGIEGGPVADEDRYIEIWNLVFMQNERGAGIGKDNFEILNELPKKNIDTGLGVERVAFLLQGVDNVYETDLLRPVISLAETLTGRAYGANADDDVRFRVIADHSRTAVMLIGDGVTPGNEGRGYILRRLVRRIIRSARLLGATGAIMDQLAATVIELMSPSYPELAADAARIRKIVAAEEASFLRTLESGTRLFDNAAAAIKAAGKSELSGQQAFQLHDTYGFPIDLTLEIAAENGLSVDEEGFSSLMAEQRARAKADSNAKKHAHADLSVYKPFVDAGVTEFRGFEELESEATIIGLIRDGVSVERAAAGEDVAVILNRTPFYAEAGGQLGDRGRITDGDTTAVVTDVQRILKAINVHSATITHGELAVGQTVAAAVDPVWRRKANQAHSGTHMVHAALRQVLGPDAVQAGSLNKPGYLRFDFTYGQQLTEQQRDDIAAIANGAVDANYSTITHVTSLEEAKAMGAMALFGENYGDIVRVVDIGGEFSRELCGGTHVEHSSQIGPIALLGEASVGSGVRRVEAFVGTAGFEHFAKEHVLASNLATMLKVPTEDVADRVSQLVTKLKDAERQIEQMHQARIAAQSAEMFLRSDEVNGVRFIAAGAPQGAGGRDLRTVASAFKQRLGDVPAVAVIVANEGDKVPFIVAVSQPAQEMGLKAGDIVKEIAPLLGARGGGKADVAQGSGTDASGTPAAWQRVREILTERS